MEFPLVLNDGFSDGASAVAAVLTGLGFGVTLERAGFGRADNLASVFYGRDFRVLRVMFTAIVTAMVGLYLFDLFGVMPIGQVGLLPTYLWPQLVGGLLLGFGFILGGYCPGTSVVAAASGKVDALFFLGGLAVGTSGALVSYPAWAAFHQTGSLGRYLLPEWLGWNSGVVVLAVALMAVGMFVGAGFIEARVGASLRSKS